jgi:hypothetical protein
LLALGLHNILATILPFYNGGYIKLCLPVSIAKTTYSKKMQSQSSRIISYICSAVISAKISGLASLTRKTSSDFSNLSPLHCVHLSEQLGRSGVAGFAFCAKCSIGCVPLVPSPHWPQLDWSAGAFSLSETLLDVVLDRKVDECE